MRLNVSRCTKKVKWLRRSTLKISLKWSTYIVCNLPPSLSFGGLCLLPIFLKKGPDRISVLIGRLLEKRGWLFWAVGGSDRSFCIKNKLKSEILNNNKKPTNQKCLSAITKNLSWQILTKNLVTFKRYDGVKDEKVLILWEFSSPIFNGGGSQK